MDDENTTLLSRLMEKSRRMFLAVRSEVFIALLVVFVGISGSVFLYYLDKGAKQNIPEMQVVHHLPSGLYAFDGRTKNPVWVLQVLRPGIRENMEDNVYQEDKTIPSIMHQQLTDYQNSGFEIGYLWDVSREGFFKTTFPLSTTSPQAPEFNKGYWEKLNTYVMEMSNKPDISQVLVITGPLFLPRKESDGKHYVSYQVIGENNVAVPTHFFKAIFYHVRGSKDFNDFSINSEIYVVPNHDINENVALDSFKTSLENLEKISGIVFPDDIKSYLMNNPLPKF